MHEVIGDICEDFDVLDVSPSAEEVERKIRKVGVGKKWRPIMVLATDGAHVPTGSESFCFLPLAFPVSPLCSHFLPAFSLSFCHLGPRWHMSSIRC